MKTFYSFILKYGTSFCLCFMREHQCDAFYCPFAIIKRNRGQIPFSGNDRREQTMKRYPPKWPLTKAVIDSDWESVRKLIASGADVNADDWEYKTALMYAAECSDNPEIINELIAAGAKVDVKDYYGNTALMFAARNNNPEIVKALLAAGADVNAINKSRYSPMGVIKEGKTALMFAAEYNKNPEIIKELIAAGAKVNVKDKEHSETALMRAVMTYNSNPEIVKALLAAGADVNAQDKAGKTVLALAKERKDIPVEIVKILVDAGAVVNVKGGNKKTFLMRVAEFCKNWVKRIKS